MSRDLVLITIGTMFLAGLALDAVGRRAHVPRVTLLILFGVALGPSALDLVPPAMTGEGELFAPTALTMVAFLLGGHLDRRSLAAHGREILVMSAAVVGVSVLLVAGGLWLLAAPVPMALLMGTIAAATAPAATLDVIRQSGRQGRFVTNLAGIVAIDDAWGLVLFSLALTVAGAMLGAGVEGPLWHGLHEAGGSVALGLAVGLPGAALTGRVKPGEPTLVEALGLVFLTAGLALWLDLSYLLAGMVAGATIVNLARHHERPFHEIERIEWPFLLLFFVLAGASLEVAELRALGAIGLAYVALRAVARVAGGMLGAALAGLPLREGRLMGLALMPQAGVAIGMALVVAERFPHFGEALLTMTVASTVIFELAGPYLTLFALDRVTEAPREGTGHRR